MFNSFLAETTFKCIAPNRPKGNTIPNNLKTFEKNRSSEKFSKNLITPSIKNPKAYKMERIANTKEIRDAKKNSPFFPNLWLIVTKIAIIRETVDIVPIIINNKMLGGSTIKYRDKKIHQLLV